MGRLIRTDFHIHTNHSVCGSPEATPPAIVRAAHEAGLDAIALIDHVSTPAHFAAPMLVREELPGDLGGLRVYVGCEADMLALDKPSIPRDYAAQMDLVLFSPSHLDRLGPNVLDGLDGPAIAALVLDLTRTAIGTGYADIIAHPFHVPTGGCPSFGELATAVDERDLRDLLALAADTGVAMEANPRFLKADPPAATWLFRLFMEMGCKLAVNSDTHHPRGVGCRGPAFATEADLRAVGITEDHLFRIEDRVTRALR